MKEVKIAGVGDAIGSDSLIVVFHYPQRSQSKQQIYGGISKMVELSASCAVAASSAIDPQATIFRNQQLFTLFGRFQCHDIFLVH
jgi:hypothetical protein